MRLGLTRESRSWRRYKKARNFTAGVAFFSGNGMLEEDILEEVQRRYDLRKDKEHKEHKIVRKKKKKLIELRLRVNAVKAFIRTKKSFKTKDLKVAQLKDFCRWKKQPGDRPLPNLKAALVTRFDKTKGNQSPNVSPCNSQVDQDDENFSDVDSLDTDASANDVDEIEFGVGSDREKEEDEGGSNSEKEEDEDGSDSEDESEIEGE